jgi:glycerophosphoryl diester phosphodiesterase
VLLQRRTLTSFLRHLPLPRRSTPALVLAHRGGSWPALPENSLAAFERAFERRVDGIEFDVRATADGRLVVHHDPHAVGDDGTELAIDLTPRAELPPLADGTPVPSLDQLLELWRAAVEASDGGYRPLLDTELKVTGLERQVLAAYERHGVAAGDSVITSFLPDALVALHDVDLDQRLGLIVPRHDDRAPAELVGATLAVGATLLAPHHALVTDELLDAAHEAGVGVAPWTVNDTRQLARLRADRRVEAVITDHPPT